MVIGDGALLLLDSAGAFRLGWDWALVLACLVAGVGLLTVAPPSRAQYVGTLARVAGPRTKLLWGLRAGTVATAPLAGLGPGVYGLLTLRQALAEDPASEQQPDGRRSVGTGLVVPVIRAGCRRGGVGAWGATGSCGASWSGSSGLSLYWWGARPGPWRLAGRAGASRASPSSVRELQRRWASTWTARTPTPSLAAAAGALAATLVVGPRWLGTYREPRGGGTSAGRPLRRSARSSPGVVHDSVLQTLALIQSGAVRPASPGDSRASGTRAARLALAETDSTAASKGGAVCAVADEVEDTHE